MSTTREPLTAMDDRRIRVPRQSLEATVAASPCTNGHDWALIEVEFGGSGSFRRYECRCGAINYDLCR